MQYASGAVREISAAMARKALQIHKMLPPVLSGNGRAAIALAVISFWIFVERRYISGQRVEVGTETGLGIAQRRAARAGIVVRIAHESGPAERIADVAFEVLDFVEIG